MPGWHGSDRRSRLPPGWDKLRKRVLRDAGHRCQVLDTYGVRCTEPALDVDHIINDDNHSYFGPGDERNNLRAICEWHHDKKSSAEGAAARWAAIRRSSKKFTRTETHPGLL